MTADDQMTTEPHDIAALEQARRDKLQRWREQYGIEPYGNRVDGLIPLAEARALFDEVAHDQYSASVAAQKEDPNATIDDRRPRALVAGRCIQHRAMGKLVFIVLRDHSGDLQISVSKAAVDQPSFKLASKLDYGDIVVAGGPVGRTNKGEICIWADRFEVHCKSLAPPPEKYHGLTDAELRYRQRYVDMFANPQTIRTFTMRSMLLTKLRRFMDARGYLEVETPVLQSIAGGAAARPFITHHNALGMDLFLRIATELPLKRLLVGGMPKVFEIGRLFRNEGVDRSHNPEFTTIEAYESFGDCWSMLELTESLLHELAQFAATQREAGPEQRSDSEAASEERSDEGAGNERAQTGPHLSFGDRTIDWSRPFPRVKYADMFDQVFGFTMHDEDKVRAAGREHHIDNAETLNHWLLVNELYEHKCEPAIDHTRPTFITDYPSAISPLTRPQRDNPVLCDRWELLVAGMELGTAYSELNDPDIQYAKFTEQLAGADEEEASFRSLDEDFLHALKVGMPPAGGLGLGIDRIVMLMTGETTIRDVILFPLMKPEEKAETVKAES